MRFSKWHALGNDYLLIERSDAGSSLQPQLVRRLCEPHCGIGADGVLEVVSARGARAEIVIWNRDGTTAELSGNGTRIVARWLARRSAADTVVVDIGGRTVTARIGVHLDVEQDLGVAVVSAPEPLEVDGETVVFTPVSIGNPHAVIRRDPARPALLRLGPLIERHPRFPERTNVQLVRVEGPHAAVVGVWERGAGETLSSGTSACAAAAAAIANGWCRSPVSVHLPGGELTVEIGEDWSVRLNGPAQEICSGEVSHELLASIQTATP